MAIKSDLGRGTDTLFLGKTWTIVVTITGADEDPLVLTGATAIWVLKRSASTQELVRKTEADGIAFSDQDAAPGQLTITVQPEDTDGIAYPNGGQLYHQLDLTLSGAEDCAMYGSVLVHRIGIAGA